MVRIRLTTGQNINCPDSWGTCSTEIFQNIAAKWEPKKPIKERSRLELFNIMVGMELTGEEDDMDLEAAIWECTRFVYEEAIDFKSLPLPVSIKIGDKTIMIPKDLGRVRIGQNIHVRQELQNTTDPNTIMSIIVAIYIQPLVDGGHFDFHRAKEIEKIILQRPITEIYPIGFFLLKRLRSYGKGLLPDLHRMIRRKMQSVQLLLNWRKLKNLINSIQ